MKKINAFYFIFLIALFSISVVSACGGEEHGSSGITGNVIGMGSSGFAGYLIGILIIIVLILIIVLLIKKINAGGNKFKH